jgi:hypothetical protein
VDRLRFAGKVERAPLISEDNFAHEDISSRIKDLLKIQRSRGMMLVKLLAKASHCFVPANRGSERRDPGASCQKLARGRRPHARWPSLRAAHAISR